MTLYLCVISAMYRRIWNAKHLVGETLNIGQVMVTHILSIGLQSFSLSLFFTRFVYVYVYLAVYSLCSYVRIFAITYISIVIIISSRPHGLTKHEAAISNGFHWDMNRYEIYIYRSYFMPLPYSIWATTIEYKWFENILVYRIIMYISMILLALSMIHNAKWRSKIENINDEGEALAASNDSRCDIRCGCPHFANEYNIIGQPADCLIKFEVCAFVLSIVICRRSRLIIFWFICNHGLLFQIQPISKE